MSILMKRAHLPEALKDVYVDFHWSQRKLWALPLQESELEVTALEWILDYPVWYLDPHPVPSSLLEESSIDLQHWKRVQDADLEYPIHVIGWRGRMLIIDGIHRLIKAKLMKREVVKVKILSEADIKHILPDIEDMKTGFLKRTTGVVG